MAKIAYYIKNLSLLFIMLTITIFVYGQIKVISNGNVGIGTANPNSNLHLYTGYNSEGSFLIDNWTDIVFDWTGVCCGSPVMYPSTDWYLQLGKPNKKLSNAYFTSIFCNNISFLSDERTKENIILLSNPLEKIKRISAYSFNFKTNLYPEDLPNNIKSKLIKKQIGFLAQELETEFPELVNVPDSTNDFYSINYNGMIAILLEAIKQQQIKIDSLQECYNSQNQKIINMEKTISKHCYSNNNVNKNTSTLNSEIITNNIILKSKLFDNIPNPFSEITEIKFEISNNASSGQIMICNLNGLELKSYIIERKGLGSIIIQGSEFPAGIYLYTLIVDNKIVDSKKMILTK